MKTGFQIRMLLAFILASLVATIGCDDDEITIGERGITVTGKVTDSGSGLLIDSVLISWGDTLVQKLDGFSDSVGEYALSVPQTAQIIWARKEGYVSKGREIVGVNSDLTLTGFDFELRAQ